MPLVPATNQSGLLVSWLQLDLQMSSSELRDKSHHYICLDIYGWLLVCQMLVPDPWTRVTTVFVSSYGWVLACQVLVPGPWTRVTTVFVSSYGWVLACQMLVPSAWTRITHSVFR